MSTGDNIGIVFAVGVVMALVVTFAGALYGFPTDWATEIFVIVFTLGAFLAIGFGFINALS